MNILIDINGADVTDSCLLSATTITYDSSKRITTASITIMGQPLGAAAMYDYAHYDEDVYSLDLRETYVVTIFDGRDGTTVLFRGQIFSFSLTQSDSAQFSVFYQCDLNDYASFLDRAVCWGGSVPLTFPASDKQIIQALLGAFCPQIDPADVQALVPQINAYDWKTKTCRQVLDDMTTLSLGEWRVDFDGKLHYGPASAAPAAPFSLSTVPDNITSFPVKVSAYKHDFTNPVNTAYVRGSVDPTSGVPIEATYQDPLSISRYGAFSYAIVDDQILTGWDASLRAKSIVLRYAWPLESGNFTIWKDGLACGQQVSITEANLGFSGAYMIRQLSLHWEDKYTVRYEAQFGASQPDLETILRLIAQRTAWKSALAITGNTVPAAGSVTDASIAPGGLSASVINSVNANTIQGQIQSGQIGSVNAGAIVGQVQATQIQSVAANTIQGAIQAGQIGSVNATTIQGVVVSQQLADGIINNLAKYADALRPVPIVKTAAEFPPSPWPNPNFPPNSFFYYVPDGHFYQISADGMTWHQNDNPQGSLMNFYHIGAISANSIIGLIVAAQIQSITAGQITGSIQASQIGGVNASSINGTIQANQIAAVNASVIQGTIAATQIQSITAGQITGTLAYTQIGSIDANTITINQIGDSQIKGISGGKINAGTINVGGGAGMPGQITVYDGSSQIVAQIGNLGSVGAAGSFGGWFKLFGAGGTNYGNAPIYTDAGGNLFIRNQNLTNANITDPTFKVNGSSAVIATSPTTFDPTYSALAMTNTQGADMASFVSRGLILYYSGTKVASFIRDPGGSWASLEFPNTLGNGYIILNGHDGTIRADGGYGISGNVGRTVSFTLALAAGGSVTLNFKGGILVP